MSYYTPEAVAASTLVTLHADGSSLRDLDQRVADTEAEIVRLTHRLRDLEHLRSTLRRVDRVHDGVPVSCSPVAWSAVGDDVAHQRVAYVGANVAGGFNVNYRDRAVGGIDRLVARGVTFEEAERVALDWIVHGRLPQPV